MCPELLEKLTGSGMGLGGWPSPRLPLDSLLPIQHDRLAVVLSISTLSHEIIAV